MKLVSTSAGLSFSSSRGIWWMMPARLVGSNLSVLNWKRKLLMIFITSATACGAFQAKKHGKPMEMRPWNMVENDEKP